MTIKILYQHYDDIFFADDPKRTCIEFFDAHTVYCDLDCFVISFSYHDAYYRLKHGRFTFQSHEDTRRALEYINKGIILDTINTLQCDICWDLDESNRKALENIDDYYFSWYL